MKSEEIIVLFDEQGVPTFSGDTSTIIGVCLFYSSEDEQDIFDRCNGAFRLSTAKPRKNNRVSKSNAVDMVNCLGSLPVYLSAVKLNLADETLRTVVK